MAAAPTIRFRPFAPPDLAVLGPWLEREGFPPPPGVTGDMWGRRLQEDPRILCWVVCAEDGARVAFLRLDLAPDRSAELTILVAPDHRRKGIGRAVLQRSLAEARRRGLRRLVALVRGGNPAAESLFRDGGFEDFGPPVPGFLPLLRVVHRATRQPPLEISP